MKKHFLFPVAICVLLCGCHGDALPKGVMDHEQMVGFLTEAYVLESLYADFIKGGVENGHPKEVLDKIWADWRKFASYAFNKSHATCYAWVAYQTGWLKAHYPAEFQAANLSNQLSNMAELKEIMDDCKKGGIKVLSPDVNESEARFAVNKDGDIRFGLGGMKGFGSNVVDAIISEREAHGPFADIFDFAERVPGMNRKALETLVNAGAFDSFGARRTQFFLPCKNNPSSTSWSIMPIATTTIPSMPDLPSSGRWRK